MGWVQIQIAAEFVQHHQVGRIQGGLLERKGGACPGIAFGRDQSLFFRDQPRRRIARPIVQVLSGVP